MPRQPFPLWPARLSEYRVKAWGDFAFFPGKRLSLSTERCERCLTTTPPGERMRALELLLEKYSPAHKTTGLRYAEASFARTEIVRLDVVAWSGKTKRVH